MPFHALLRAAIAAKPDAARIIASRAWDCSPSSIVVAHEGGDMVVSEVIAGQVMHKVAIGWKERLAASLEASEQEAVEWSA